MAAIHAPRWCQEEWEKRRPRGSDPQGPLRGGPERSADDPRREPRGGLCGGPGRSANDTQTPPKTTSQRPNGGDGQQEKPLRSKRPIIVTVDEKGRERRWGPLTRTTVRRAGTFWEKKEGTAKVFIEMGGERREAEVERKTERGRPRFWIEEKNPPTSQEPERREDEPTPEVIVDTMDEDTPEEVEAAKKMWLNEKVTSLEKVRR